MSDENANGEKPVNNSEDQKTVPYDRFRDVNSELKAVKVELEKFQAKQKEDEERRLKESQDWKTLAEQKDKELTDLRTSLQKSKLESSVKDLVSSKKVRNPALVMRSLDFSAVGEKDGSFDLSAIETQLSELQKSDPYLFGEFSPNLGIPNAGAPENTVGRTYRKSQLADIDFYRANRADILRAKAEGRIVEG